MNTPVIGFIGQGFIGKNYANDFEKRGYKVIRFALEAEYINNKNLIKTCDIVFIAVPTPTTKNGCDTSLIEESLHLIGRGKIAVIKSTMIPGTTKKLQEKFPGVHVLHSPEFLREVSAAKDAANPERNIIGIPFETKELRASAEKVLATLPSAPFVKICLAHEAELIKYAGNNFLHTKVVYINILYDLAKKYDCDWNVISESMVADSRIGSSHMNPIHDGGRGAGGHCFIKDFAAFRYLYEEELAEASSSLSVLKALEQKNVELLRETNKNKDLLDQIYGKETIFTRFKKRCAKVMKSNTIFLMFVALATLSIIFITTGFYNIQNDTTVYKNQILYFAGDIEKGKEVATHSFKPFYGIVGATLTPLATPYQGILIINICFYLGLVLCMYLFLSELRVQKEYALLGSAWVATAYPVLKYGLALLTDVSGWFFAIITAYLFLVAKKKESNILLLLVSFIGFIGSLCKETGVLGLVFAGTFLGMNYLFTRKSLYLKQIALLSAPFLILQIILRMITKHSGGKTFIDWFLFNIHTNTSDKWHSLHYFIPVEGATFNILWVYALIGLYFIIKKELYKNTANLILGTSLFIAAAPALLWPLFYIRIFFIQILFIIPLALFGLLELLKVRQNKTLKTVLTLLPILLNFGLFFLASGKSLFDVLHI